MNRRVGSWLRAIPRQTFKLAAYAAALCGAVVALFVVAFAVQARHRLPDLRPWHRLVLENEYRAGKADAPKSFAEYRALEDRMFEELQRKLLADPAAADNSVLGRYNPKSVPAQLAWDTKYNRSFELVPPEPKGAVLLVHGLSDSPYSMRALAETFFGQGYYVLALRLPGHGTIPASLVGVSWKDWFGAVTLAAKHAAGQAGPGKPFLAGGYSTGAALVTLMSVRSLEDRSLPRPERLYLVSPAIGITPFSALMNIAAGLSFLPRFEKSKWIDVLPEYDPYKYNSFPVNAANQIRTLTLVLRSELLTAEKAGRLGDMPRVCAFQSLVDSTITAEEVVRGLLAHLPANGHELVVFDINHREALESLLAPRPIEHLRLLREAPQLSFKLTIVGNRSDGSDEIATFTREAGSRDITERDLPIAWPKGVFSLGHVALPFPPNDPVYGLTPAPGTTPGYNLGSVAAKGESGALNIPLGTFARLRCNPFFDVVRAKVVESLNTTR